MVDMTKKIHEQITEESWCPLGGGNVEGTSFCAAVWVDVRYGVTSGYDIRVKMCKLLGLNWRDPLLPSTVIHGWNDKPGRTFAEVKDLFVRLDI